MQTEFPRSMRRAYRDWVEEQIEEFKDNVPRSALLDLADEVCRELRVDDSGQYQITEILLCTAMDRRIFRLLKLPGYRAWCTQRAARVQEPSPAAGVRARIGVGRIAPVVLEPEPEGMMAVEPEPTACVA